MSYRRTYPVSVGADAPAKPSLFNLVGMDKFIKIEKADKPFPIWIVVGVGGAVALGGLALLMRRRKKSKP